jgi:NAD(P)H-hydrate repair Nnr-like enzyme with NAD(P)H-hydrate dehydratase domain
MPAVARMGALRLVDIGCAPVAGAGRMLEGLHLTPPAPDAHKYRRGLVGVAAGQMSGAALMAARAAAGAGAGYVQMLGDDAVPVPPDLVQRPFAQMGQAAYAAILIGPGMGRDEAARNRLEQGLSMARAAPGGRWRCALHADPGDAARACDRHAA